MVALSEELCRLALHRRVAGAVKVLDEAREFFSGFPQVDTEGKVVHTHTYTCINTYCLRNLTIHGEKLSCMKHQAQGTGISGIEQAVLSALIAEERRGEGKASWGGAQHIETKDPPHTEMKPTAGEGLAAFLSL
ncbi:hypothetical protein QQF64_019302 [Cirrhinus molitorella]|uniref:Uncharacterized protein n=1 Tax=Cirrhinus molitorella TaxID=172907 RepID=A0ABR3LHE2_9TELE